MNKHVLNSVTVAILLVTFSSASFACSYTTPTIEVESSFQVKVNSGERVFSGVRVVLKHVVITPPTYKATVLYSAISDERGIAQFNNVRTGTYEVAINQLDNLGVDQAHVDVAPDHFPHDVELKWPSNKILELRALSGTLFKAPTGKPAKGLDLTLVTGLAGTLVSTTQTDESGHFDLCAPSPGFYFLRVVSPNRDLEADIPVVVVPEGKSDISLAIEETTCGPEYAELCHAEEVVTGHLRGNVADKLNPGFPAVLILSRVKNEGGLPVQSLTADKNGDFDFAEVPYGRYELKISWYSHTPLLVPVTVEAPSHSYKQLHIQLSWLNGSCSEAKIEH